MKRYILAALAAVLLLGSCVKSDDIRFVSFDDVVIHSSSRIDILLTIKNGSRKKLELRDMDMQIYSGDKKLFTVQLTKPVEIGKRTESQVVFPLRIRTDNQWELLAMAMGSGFDTRNMYLSGEVEVKFGALKKKFPVEKMRLDENLVNFGL